ncbi:MAG: sensor histidine kinase [Oliverpabstia sp.]
METLIYYIFLSRVSNPRFCKWKCILIGLCLFEVGSAFNILSHNDVFVNTSVVILIVTVFFKCCFEPSIKVSLLYSLMLAGLNFAIELVVVFAFSFLMGISMSKYQDNLAVLFMETISCKSVFFMVCLMLSNWTSKNIAHKIPSSLFIYPACVTACLLVFSYFIFSEILTKSGQILLAVASGTLLLSLIFLFSTFQHEIEKDGMLAIAQEENAHLKTEKEYFDILEKQNQNLMLYAHDVRKHLNAIREMSQDPDINEYVAKLCGELTTYTQSCQSGNKLLDVMINRYVLDCELKKISFEYSVRECPLRCLEDLDLVAILGNLMDNAITAASESEKKWVSLTTSVRNTYNVVVIKNSCDVPPQAQGERLLSTKENPRFHGYGLKSVAKAVKKYHGDQYWSYDPDNQIFTMTVILQN